MCSSDVMLFVPVDNIRFHSTLAAVGFEVEKGG